MSPRISPTMDAAQIRKRIHDHLFQRFAFASFVIWTAGCLILFILFAAGNPRPIFPAMLSMTTPLLPAFLIWSFYRPLVNWQVARYQRALPPAAPS